MAETTFTFRVDEELKSAFADAAKSQDRSAAQLLRALMREAVVGEADKQDHDSWFRGEVEDALREASDPSTVLISDEDLKADWDLKRSEYLERAGGTRR